MIKCRMVADTVKIQLRIVASLELVRFQELSFSCPADSGMFEWPHLGAQAWMYKLTWPMSCPILATAREVCTTSTRPLSAHIKAWSLSVQQYAACVDPASPDGRWYIILRFFGTSVHHF